MKKLLISILTALTVLFSVIFVPGLLDDHKKGYLILENDRLEETSKISLDEIDPEYVLNLNTKKYHKKDCIYASGISEGSYYKTSDMKYITSRGYIPCSVCFKED